ncbi:hypothetical protein GGF46_003266 [Coemansia sp. RSA 552]|nr:hypothetical protein GGF46_003266 [Coemansia sp. RSA 552]
MPMKSSIGAHSVAEPDGGAAQAGDAADLFSDPVPQERADRTLSTGRRPQFRFNFVDIYEWQYPPLATPDMAGQAPDFLRVAARECRRKGIHAKARHDDPFAKLISIAPRSRSELEEDASAHEIVMVWRLGAIDVRRVFFDDSESSDGLDEHQSDSGHDQELTLDAGGFQFQLLQRRKATAAPAEYCHAYSMLFMLWCEKAASSEDPHGDEDSVLRWIDFTQRFIFAKLRSKAALAQVAQQLVEVAQSSLVRLDSLADDSKGNLPLLAAVSVSFSTSLLHLALVLAHARGAAIHSGPQAVGEEEDVLSLLWSSTRFAREIDQFVAVAVRLLSAGTHEARRGQLEAPEQTWLVLMHIFSTAPGSEAVGHAQTTDTATLSDVVPISGMWTAVADVCVKRACTKASRVASLWSAFACLAQLSQINMDGVAAPHSDFRFHSSLLMLVEIAVEKQLLSSGLACPADDLTPSQEETIRRTFFRVHGVATMQGLRISISSPLYVSLYRYLEGTRFCSLRIEPLPSLPRFFTRYTGTIRHESSASDTCTVLWLKALDISLSRWVVQLRGLPQASKQRRRVLRDVRSVVSKMLPTRILTFTSLTASARLSTLASYYAVFLFFLHAIPSEVVRATRLYTQFQALLRFGDSASQVARRVYFEAWSAAATIVGLHLRHTLECHGDVRGMVAQLVADRSDAGAGGLPADLGDYYQALTMAVKGWAESLNIIFGEASPTGSEHAGDAANLWALVDAALMYLHRVLTSSALRSHAPTVALLVLQVFRESPMLDLLTWTGASSVSVAHASAAGRVLAIVKVWYDSVRVMPSVEACSLSANGGTAGEDPRAEAGGRNTNTMDVLGNDQDSQSYLGMIDSCELLEATVEAEELERQAACTIINALILREMHERYVPRIRLHIISMFTSLASGSHQSMLLRGRQARLLETSVSALVYMVSVCVDAGQRTWESFLDEHGRDSLHLIPSWHGRRLVLALFAMFTLDITRAKGQSIQHIETLAKDVWFASVCDLHLAPYVLRLGAQLQWSDCQAERDVTGLAVFASMPTSRHLVNELGVLRSEIGADGPRQSFDTAANDTEERLSEVYERRAALAISCIEGVLRGVSQVLGPPGGGAQVHGYQRQVHSSWVTELLRTLHLVRRDSARVQHGMVDVHDLLESMGERITLLVRDHCAELFLSSNLAVHPGP